jgi:hypothetical protein
LTTNHHLIINQNFSLPPTHHQIINQQGSTAATLKIACWKATRS